MEIATGGKAALAMTGVVTERLMEIATGGEATLAMTGVVECLTGIATGGKAALAMTGGCWSIWRGLPRAAKPPSQ